MKEVLTSSSKSVERFVSQQQRIAGIDDARLRHARL